MARRRAAEVMNHLEMMPVGEPVAERLPIGIVVVGQFVGDRAPGQETAPHHAGFRLQGNINGPHVRAGHPDIKVRGQRAGGHRRKPEVVRPPCARAVPLQHLPGRAARLHDERRLVRVRLPHAVAMRHVLQRPLREDIIVVESVRVVEHCGAGIGVQGVRPQGGSARVGHLNFDLVKLVGLQSRIGHLVLPAAARDHELVRDVHRVDPERNLIGRDRLVRGRGKMEAIGGKRHRAVRRRHIRNHRQRHGQRRAGNERKVVPANPVGYRRHRVGHERLQTQARDAGALGGDKAEEGIIRAGAAPDRGRRHLSGVIAERRRHPDIQRIRAGAPGQYHQPGLLDDFVHRRLLGGGVNKPEGKGVVALVGFGGGRIGRRNGGKRGGIIGHVLHVGAAGDHNAPGIPIIAMVNSRVVRNRRRQMQNPA